MFDSGVPYMMLQSFLDWKHLWLTLSDPFLAGSSCCVKRAVICGHLTAQQQQQNFMLLPRSGSVLHHQSTSPSVSRSYPSALHCYEINAIWIPSEWGSHMLFVSLCLECFIYYIRSSPVTAMEQIPLFLPFFTDEWHLSVCVHGIFVSIGVGESSWVSLPFSASVSSAHCEWKCSRLTTPPSFSLTASAE